MIDHKLLDQIVAGAALGVIVVDASLKVQLWNEWMVSQTSIKNDVALGQELSEIFPDFEGSRLDKALQSAIKYGSSALLSYKLNPVLFPMNVTDSSSETGMRRMEQVVSISAASDGEGNIFGIIRVQDVSLAVNRERALEGALNVAKAANDMKSEFLATMSHEIRTPLNGVMGMAQVLGGTELNAEQRNYLKVMERSGKSLLELINNILDLSKLEVGMMTLFTEDIALKPLLQDVIALFAQRSRDKKVSLKLELDPAVPSHIHADPARLRQVLLNLIGNALKFTTSGTVKLHVVGAKLNKQPGLKFEVIDTGIGIDEKEMDYLFEKFRQADSSTTRNYEGTGLGLSICQEIVELWAGAITVKSNVGEGSTFSFTMPYSFVDMTELEAAIKAKAAIFKESKEHPLNILVAEDNPVNQLLLESILVKAGHTVTAVSNGIEAIEKVGATDPFDVILMDISMPEMDGVEATAKIRAMKGPVAATPIIALTAHALAGDKENFLSQGMNAYQSKPIVAASLLSKIFSVILNDPA